MYACCKKNKVKLLPANGSGAIFRCIAKVPCCRLRLNSVGKPAIKLAPYGLGGCSSFADHCLANLTTRCMNFPQCHNAVMIDVHSLSLNSLRASFITLVRKHIGKHAHLDMPL